MGSPLVIVESPAKAKTIAKFLGDDYAVESSVGHIRDLPAKAAEVPKSIKGEKWASLGVNPDDHFKPVYVVAPQKKDQVRALKELLKDADELYLATDEDREGEAIAWHLLEVLKPKVPVKRMVFHEITKDAILNAIANPRELDRRLVDAQEARRIYDRLYGFEVSPVLWKKIMPRLSAGRVQSVATRIIVERERERMAFVEAGYWGLEASLAGVAGADSQPFVASLLEVDGKRVATGKDFDQAGNLTKDTAVVLSEQVARALASGLGDATAGTDGRFRVRSLERKPYTRKPYPPFMTSTLQQEAGRKLRFSASQTMSLAQRLYQGGHITYMRTDSTTLSETAVSAARSQILERYGKDYLPDAPRQYSKKVKNAQEAHEAIRPAGDTFKTPDELRGEVGSQEHKLYDLIWKRTVASQMMDARGESVSIRLEATADAGEHTLFGASGRTIQFPGFLAAYVSGEDQGEGKDDEEKVLPNLVEGNQLAASNIEPKGHTTQPPSRYTEASLVRRLEELGVGRPSTYAATISTILDRGYVRKKGSALVPSFTAFAVVGLLEQHFPELVDYAMTASMEDDLDKIARGEAESEPWLTKFYFGDGPANSELISVQEGVERAENPGLKYMVTDLGAIDARAVNSIPIGADANGELIVARVGRYGPYIQLGEQSASIPDDIAPDELTVELCLELLATPKDLPLGTHPDTGLTVYLKSGRFGPYVQMGEHDDENDVKPKMSSLFKHMEPKSVTLEDAIQLLSLPRVVGVDPATDEEVTAQNGRFGPYIKKGTDSRSLESEDQLLTISFEECQRIFSEPKRRRGQTAKPPLREMGIDPDTEKPIKIKDGRFGPYVTDGVTNASLRRGDLVEEISFERALELLADRREKGPSTKKKAPAKKKKASAKKGAAKKKAPAKKTAAKKKAPAKKAPAKKSGS